MDSQDEPATCHQIRLGSDVRHMTAALRELEPISGGSEPFAAPAIRNVDVVEFVAVKAPKSHKDQQGSAGARQAIQYRPLIFTKLQRDSISDLICISCRTGSRGCGYLPHDFENCPYCCPDAMGSARILFSDGVPWVTFKFNPRPGDYREIRKIMRKQ